MLSSLIYRDERAAREYFESLRWPEGPVCPHCGCTNDATPMCGKSTRPGVWKCHQCRKPFTCTVGTVCEGSKVALSKWLLMIHLMEASARRVSARQLHLRLGVSYKTAQSMMRRVRYVSMPHRARTSIEKAHMVLGLPARDRSAAWTPSRDTASGAVCSQEFQAGSHQARSPGPM